MKENREGPWPRCHLPCPPTVAIAVAGPRTYEVTSNWWFEQVVAVILQGPSFLFYLEVSQLPLACGHISFLCFCLHGLLLCFRASCPLLPFPNVHLVVDLESRQENQGDLSTSRCSTHLYIQRLFIPIKFHRQIPKIRTSCVSFRQPYHPVSLPSANFGYQHFVRCISQALL